MVETIISEVFNLNFQNRFHLWVGEVWDYFGKGFETGSKPAGQDNCFHCLYSILFLFTSETGCG